ncbi:tRNA (guanine-N(7)-)-methyltransferase [Paralcaligenes ureilyticus]|uniref:tRNA (guanine-N(7)-)-methyltransferase n=2 Tax=Paralcaligenes ureilyticus TaxID=627131 RepID=A0A4R3MBK7_9BURK|nr:tRNA (guanine-N(7)-)-methyltransferase [Paralcaligenes ureilyticus]
MQRSHYSACMQPARKPAAVTTIAPMNTIKPTLQGQSPDSAGPAAGEALAAHPGPGHIRSFVHRRSHITPGQKEALDSLMPLWALPYRAAVLEFDKVFGRHAATILEIGFGMGETTEKIATTRSGDNFLGVEVFNAGVGALLKRIEACGLQNIRIIQHDAVEVVRDMIAPDSLAGIHIYFPDPWPKSRHHKRRLIQPPFIDLLASRLAPGGYIHCATDWENYAQQMLAVLGAEPRLKNSCEGYAPRPDFRPQTKFETRGLRLGHGVWDLIFTRKEKP